METQKSLETLIKLASNPECLPSLLDGLSGCIQAIITVTEQVDVDSLDQLLMTLMIQIVQVSTQGYCFNNHELRLYKCNVKLCYITIYIKCNFLESQYNINQTYPSFNMTMPCQKKKL